MNKETLLKYCDRMIKEIQNGGYPDRSNFPDTMKGEIAKDKWYDVMFSYGMEYGYLHAMCELREALKCE
jgi:hypothetical protein